ncbi:MAG: ABC transporter transmembrane domain-containing protein, partial [Candidatus Thorarchaeota archaeon]
MVQPSASSRPRFFLEGEKSKLIHPRSVLWKWLFSYIKPFRTKFIIFLVLLLVGTLISSITPIISASIIDNGIIARDYYYIIFMSTFYFSLLPIMAIITYYSQFGMGKISQKITFDIRNDLFFKLQDMSLSYFDLRSSGDIISITTNDVTLLNQLVGGQFVQIITSIVSLILTIVIMYLLNIYLALISMIVFPIFFMITYLFRKVAMNLFKESRKTIGSVTSSIQENVAGAKVVQAYGQQKRASSEFDRANTANYNAMLKIRRFMATIFPLISLSTSILTAGVLLAGGFTVLGNISVFEMTVTVGVLSAYISILGQFFRPFMTLMQIQEVTAASLAASDRIYTLLHEKVEIPDIDNPKILEKTEGTIDFDFVSFGYNLNENRLINLGSKTQETVLLKRRSREIREINTDGNKDLAERATLSNSSEEILQMIKLLEKSLKNKTSFQQGSGGGLQNEGPGMISGGLSQMTPKIMLKRLARTKIPIEIFEQIPIIVRNAIEEEKKIIQYEHSTGFVLKDVSFNIPKGKTVAIVGETGSGKTTIVKLISRFYDIAKGDVKVDGVNIREVSKEQLRDLIGLVPQDAFLFTGTIKENLLYGFDEFSPELENKMFEVSKFLGLHNFIEALHKKYDTKLKENASNISIGQRQLIAFARALITDP